MFRTHTCGELRKNDVKTEVTLAGWVQSIRKFGAITFIDLRDRYGVTQLLFAESLNPQLDAAPLGREFVLQATGKVSERTNKNPNLPTGDVEILVSEFKVLNKSAVPPFTIQEDTDGGDDLRMKYRYLDLRRPALRRNLELRYNVNRSARNYLHENGFMDIETPFLIKSTPEGARDFVVPSRMNPGEFYALPQSPQTFKQLLMVSGYDRYYQIVKCFRDEDLRADRQPEFTQIDCEMSFVEQEDILNMFEGLIKRVFKDVKNLDYYDRVERMTWEEAMWQYGNDKPDIRFGMKLANLKYPQHTFPTKENISHLVAGEFAVFNDAETVIAIAVPGCAEYTRKQTDELTDWVKRPQIGMKGLAFIKCNADGTYKSSIDKFYTEDKLKAIADAAGARAGDLVLILAGAEERTRKATSELRLEMGKRLGMRSPKLFSIVNRTIDFGSKKKVYSLRIPIGNEKSISGYDVQETAIINSIKKCLTKTEHSQIDVLKLENESITPIFGDRLDLDRKKLDEIISKKKNGAKRQKTHYFIFFEGDQFAFSKLDAIRTELWNQLNIAYKFLWVLDFPLFEYDEDGNRWVARHHPFTSPKPSDIETMIGNDPVIHDAAKYLEHPYANIKANAYDMVINGNEIGGGSIRIYQRELQEKMFAALGIPPEEQQHKFGFLLGAFEYGAPPHGGLAFGFDRLCAIIGGSEGIRDFIAFPKNNSGRDVMLDAPGTIDQKQFDELQIKLDLKKTV